MEVKDMVLQYLLKYVGDMQTTDRTYIYKAQKELLVKILKLQDFYVRRCLDLLKLCKQWMIYTEHR